MPRTRKPQTSTTSVQWRGRATNTTTSSQPLVYRFWNTKWHPSCKAPTSSVTTVSPLHVQIVGDNVYHITLNTEELASKLWQLENLDLSNVTVSLNTVEWPVELTWNLNIADWTLTATWANIDTITSTSITATSWTISNITSTTWNITNINATDVNTWTLDAASDVTVGWTLDVTGNAAFQSNVSVAGNETVTWSITAQSVAAQTGTISNVVANSVSTWTLEANQWATIHQWLTVSEWANIDTLNMSGNSQLWGTLSVVWASTFTWDVNTNNIYSSWTASLNDVAIAWNETVTWTSTVNWATLLNSTLTVVGTTTMWSNASVAGNLNVAWNGSVTWTFNAGGDTTLGWKITVTDVATFNNDVNVNDDLTVTWTSHLAWVETTWSVDVTGTIRTTWAINAGNWVYVTWQVESDSVVTTNTTTDNLTVNGNFVLGNDATAWDFVLQSEKGQANGVAPLNANGKVDEQYLPEVFTTCKAKVVQWVFNNSNTAVVVDEDITADAFVKTSNYQDIVWDLTEVISVGQITVTSNTAETGSFKVLIVKPVL